jgi:NADPH-dependent 2,4-dienoyl-CoA reductase/sulfur reductase-like enzyme
VIAPESQPLELILGPDVGGRVRRLHEEHGVAFYLGRKPTSIEAGSLKLDDGTDVAADIVVVGVGVAPRLELAESAGMAVDRGVNVNPYLETGVPNIWAAGDIAAWPGGPGGARIRVEHWVVAQRQGATAARNMLGRREAFTEVPFFWTQQYDVTLCYVGHGAGWESATVSGDLDGNDALVAYRKGGAIVAVATIFRDQDSLRAAMAIERGDTAALEALAGG